MVARMKTIALLMIYQRPFNLSVTKLMNLHVKTGLVFWHKSSAMGKMIAKTVRMKWVVAIKAVTRMTLVRMTRPMSMKRGTMIQDQEV